MDSKANNPNESSASDNLDNSTCTMLDVLRENEELEENVAAVLGGSNDKFCTYDEGYVKRQALYSCLTCIPSCKDDPKLAIALCLACCNKCHEDHETIELYTKRDVRCDCGLKGSPRCSLRPKTLPNTENSYNQNYSGVYCICHRPYPDPEDTIADEMLQCIACEDWYHGRHLNSLIPKNDSYAELICHLCMEKHEFLALYTGWAIEEGSAEDSTVDVTGTDEPGTSSAEPEAKKIKLDPSTTKKVGECQKPDQKSEKYKGGSSFWPQEWRKNLCKCRDCMNLYEKEKVLFLVDLEDSIHYYEEKGKKMVKTSMESGMEALSSLDRTQQIEAIAGYNDMKTRLMNYLQSFVVNRTIVTEDDINKFFTSMKEEKSKGAAGQPPSTCR